MMARRRVQRMENGAGFGDRGFGDRILIKKDGYAAAARRVRCPSDQEEPPGVWLMP